MRRTSLFTGILIAGLYSCNQADNKVPGIATDLCQCFSSIEKNSSPQTKEIFLKASNASDPKKILQEEISLLDENAQVIVRKDLLIFSEIDKPASSIGKCIGAIKKKYGKANAFNETKFTQKIVEELQSKAGCSFTASVMKMGMTVEDNDKD
jgi:hypothetical protein